MHLDKPVITGSTPITYLFFNLDTGCQLSQGALDDYARVWPRGAWFQDSSRLHSGGPVLIGYGYSKREASYLDRAYFRYKRES